MPGQGALEEIGWPRRDIHLFNHLFMCIYINIIRYMYICVYVYICTCVYIYIYICIYTYTRIIVCYALI